MIHFMHLYETGFFLTPKSKPLTNANEGETINTITRDYVTYAAACCQDLLKRFLLALRFFRAMNSFDNG